MDLIADLLGPLDPIFVGVAVLVGFSILLLLWGLARIAGAGEERIEERLEQFTARMEEAPVQAAAERARPLFVERINEAMARRSFAEQTATDLARADLKLTVAEYILFNLASVFIGLLLGILLFQDVLGIVGGVVGIFFPRLYVRLRQGRRLNSFNNQLGDAISLLANSLRSGYSLLQAMETVANELSPPISDEFGRVIREIGLGISNEDALNNLLRRIDSDDLDLMITAINVQHEVGGNLAEILDSIGHTIRERVRIQGEIRTLTAMQRGSGYILSLLPVALFGFMYIMNRPYMSILFEDQCGVAMLITAVFGIVTGFLAIRKLVAIEV